jgi:hypothetical protein
LEVLLLLLLLLLAAYFQACFACPARRYLEYKGFTRIDGAGLVTYFAVHIVGEYRVYMWYYRWSCLKAIFPYAIEVEFTALAMASSLMVPQVHLVRVN